MSFKGVLSCYIANYIKQDIVFIKPIVKFFRSPEMPVFHFILYKFRTLQLIYTPVYFHIVAIKTVTETASRWSSLGKADRSNSGYLLSSIPPHTSDYNGSGFGNDVLECKRLIVSTWASPICLKTLLLKMSHILVTGHGESN